MAKFCLTRQTIDRFKKALKDREIDPLKLSGMTSLERRSFLEKYVGKENAVNTNALFESKLLLKNQKAGFISWAKKITGITPQIKMDIISKIERMDKILDPKEQDQFLQDLANTRLGTEVTQEEAKIISNFSNKISELKVKANISGIEKMGFKEAIEYLRDKTNNEKRMEYGRAVIQLDNYITGLKQTAQKISLGEAIKQPIETIKNIGKTALDTSKATKASLDLSALLNQGYPMLANVFTAKIWAKNAFSSITDAVKTVGGKEVWDEIRADAVSRPNYVNGMYKASKLAVMVTEEDFPTSLPEKIPVIGKFYKASEIAFTGFQLKNRMDAFDLFLAIGEKVGQKITTANVKDTGLGQLVNSLTARGSLGKLEPVANVINAPFFSLRKQAATVDSLFFYQLGKKSGFTRTMGAFAALQQILLIALVLTIAKTLKHDSVDFDSNSADFGKIKVGDSRFDITQGRSSYLTLASRIATGNYKSSTTDNISLLNQDKIGSKSKTDLIGDFTQNKLSPFLQESIYVINERDREGKKPTVGSIVSGLYTPLGIENIINSSENPNSANLVAIAIADGVGIPANTYPNSNIKTGIIPENRKIGEKSFMEQLSLYSRAFGTDPETAFNRIFTGQRILKIENGAIIVERMSVGDSQAYKKKYGANTKQMKLDHTIPLELGGGNDTGNLKLVSTSDWSSYTKVENALGRALKNKKISKSEAQSQIKKFKSITSAKERKIYGENLINKYK